MISAPARRLPGPFVTAITLTVAAAAVTGAFCPRAFADELGEAIQGLAKPTDEALEASIRKLAALDDPRAIRALDALCDARLRVGPDGKAYVFDAKTRDLVDPVTGQVVTQAPRAASEVEVSNEIRRLALPVLAQLQLGSPQAGVRLAAAEELSKTGDAQAASLLHRALERERERAVHEALELAVARVDLQSAEPAER